MLDPSHGSSGARSSKLDAADSQRDLLELHLIQLRQEAFAARLEAKAARLEILLRRMASADESPDVLPSTPQATPSSSKRDSQRRKQRSQPLEGLPAEAPVQAAEAPVQSPVQAARQQGSPRVTRQPVGSVAVAVKTHTASPTTRAHNTKPPQASRDPGASRESKPSRDSATSQRPAKTENKADSITAGPANATIDPTQSIPTRSRRRAVVVSAALHLAILAALALVTLQSQQPKDQVCLSASRLDATPESLETVTIESSEPAVEPSRSTLQETTIDVSAQELSQPIDVQPEASAMSAIANSIGDNLLSPAPAAGKLAAASGEPITFCGVEGGGNHFVYLVDCSRSMGPAFESARRELIASINSLKPDQRFFVIFFDADPDYMSFPTSGDDNRSSVCATPDNKRALQSWAQTIKMDRGAAPYEPLRFALELKPDVIFLLSDGEFPQGIEQLLQEHNRVSNLFGEDRPKSIVHTIGYHSQDGEQRMRAIASQNQGQYRHVPKPVIGP